MFPKILSNVGSRISRSFRKLNPLYALVYRNFERSVFLGLKLNESFELGYSVDWMDDAAGTKPVSLMETTPEEEELQEELAAKRRETNKFSYKAKLYYQVSSPTHSKLTFTSSTLFLIASSTVHVKHPTILQKETVLNI